MPGPGTLQDVAELKFEEVVDMYYSTLYRFALSLTKNETEACDLTQQAFYVWATKGHQLRDPAKVKSWLLTTLHRDFLHSRKHEQRFPHQTVELASDQLPHVPSRVVEEMDGQQVLAALSQVDEVYRVPLMLFYLDDFSYKDIADMLEVPAGTVMSRLSRGKAQLRQIMRLDSHHPKIASLPLFQGGEVPNHG